MAKRPDTMKAWRKHFSSTKPVLEEIPVPSPPDDGLLIKIHAAGVCHSDVALLAAKQRPAHWPSEVYTLGHEGSGEVVEVGTSVQDFQVGDMVSILPVPGCQLSDCRLCGKDLAQICQTGEHYGIGHDGAFTEYVAVKSWAAVRIPKGVSVEEAAVATDACMTAYHAVVGTAKVQPNEKVMLIGLGGLGFNALQIVQSIGARVFVTDTRQEVLDAAVQFGMDKADIIPPGKPIAEFVKENQLEIDTIIDFAGLPETCSASQEAVAFGGKIVQVGLLGPQLNIDNFVVIRKHLSILFSYGGTMRDVTECLSLIASGKLKPQVERGKLSEFPQVLEKLHAGKIKSRIALIPDF